MAEEDPGTRRSLLAQAWRLVRPDVPEPIRQGTWRQIQKVVLGLSLTLPWLNVLSWVAAPENPQADYGAFDAFLLTNVACHGANALLNGLLLVLPFDPRRARLGVMLSVPLALGTSLGALWVFGSVTNVLNIVFFVVILAASRLWTDARIGLWALGCAVGMHGALVAAEIGGLLTPQALLPNEPSPWYGEARAHAMSFAWIAVGYLFAWGLASFVALRFRENEHALNVLNASLEQRVEEQVAELQRSGRLRRYLPPQLVDELMQGEERTELARDRREITVFFCDLQGFTPLVEKLHAADLAELLNRYLDRVATIAFAHGGTVDKFVGDAVMVFFGAPRATTPADQATRCVQMALEVQEALESLREEAASEWGTALAVRVGIASGVATVGDFGTRDRMEFTAIGSPVNRAARLESNAPPDGILVDEATRSLVEDDAIGFEDHGPVTLKGFATPVPTWQARRT